MVRLIRRVFTVNADLTHAWDHLAKVEDWTTWAGHIKRVTMEPPGALTPTSRGTLQLTNGVKSRFEMTDFVQHRHWKWSGPFLWLRVDYDHQFEQEAPGRTRLTWTVDAEGWGVSVFGRLFALIYNRNLNKAIPRLVQELESIKP